MSQFTFDGDFEILTEQQIKLVESVLQKQGFKDGKVLVEPVGEKGDNYIAHVKRFIYNAKDGSTFKMIGKIAPVAEELRMIMGTQFLFKNEIIMYNEVLPKLRNIQDFAGITEDEKVRFPICYGVVPEAPFEFILLEDLKELGYEIVDRFQPLSNESVRLVIKDLAKYHSLSYVFKNSEPEKYKKITDEMFNIWVLMDERHSTVFESSETGIIKMFHDAGDKYIKNLTGSLTQIGPLAKKIQSYEKGSKYSVIQQGDCYSNNILFCFENGKPVQEILIDYQLSKEGNPVGDLLYMIFNCTDHATRLKHYQEWIDYYHENLEDALENHGLKANRIFPKDQFDADLRRYGRLILSLAVLLSSFLVRESKDVKDFKEMTGESETMLQESMEHMRSMDMSTIMKLRERVMGIVDSAVEFGLV